ncbi:MAG: acetoacetate--CoA ligase [Saprospiraceae bacterium]|nr:acetoacetate--CoA ligase [Saprospiraceae bacterium]
MNSYPASPIFSPSNEDIESSHLFHFLQWVNKKYLLELEDYDALWRWSVEHKEAFWSDLLHYFKVSYQGAYLNVTNSDAMPGVRWFDGITLNYAEHLLRNKLPDDIALIACDESATPRYVYWKDVESQAATLQKWLLSKKLAMGDRVVAYLPNIPEATISLLSTISTGLVWSSCSPDFGSSSVINRFRQIEPKVLIAVAKYTYGGKQFNRIQELKDIIQSIPSLEVVVLVNGDQGMQHDFSSDLPVYTWENIMADDREENLEFKQVPFNHPMWILYSSGTTGLPKAITHSHGGMLLEHLKYVHFHNDVKSREVFFWYTTTGWMMWNYLHATWLAGAVIILYDGHPTYPDSGHLWSLAESLGINHFGTSAPFIHACIKDELKLPALENLRSINSTGSPLSAEAYQWLYHSVSHGFYLWSMSGGTDMCTAFVGGCPIKPIYIGEIQCRALGCDLKVFDDHGHELFNKEGELVIVSPMPCMPIYFWNDPTGEKYKASYFDYFPGIWRHGDWITLTPHQGLIISGRSDTTLKRYGVRIGTAEIYAAVDLLPNIEDSLIIHIDSDQGEPFMPLFVKLAGGVALNEDLRTTIKKTIRTHCSPRHVPDEIYAVKDIPYTLSGKKMEAPIKKLFKGITLIELIEKGITGSMRNPDVLQEYEMLASKN